MWRSAAHTPAEGDLYKLRDGPLGVRLIAVAVHRESLAATKARGRGFPARGGATYPDEVKPHRKMAEVKSVLRAFMARGVCYFILGTTISAAVAWGIGNFGAKEHGPSSIVMVEQRGYFWVVQTWSQRGRAGATFGAMSSREKAAIAVMWAKQTYADDNELAEDREVPGWVLTVLADTWEEIQPTWLKAGFTESANALGWPCLCLKYRWVDAKVRRVASPNIGFLFIGDRFGLPYLPIWPGLLLDSLVYSLVPFGMHWAWRARVRQRQRRSDQDHASGTAPAPAPK